MDQVRLPETAFRMVVVLLEQGPTELSELAARLGVDQSLVAASSSLLVERGLVRVEESQETVYRLGPKGRELDGARLPERVVLEALVRHGAAVKVAQMADVLALDRKVVGESLKWLVERGWAVRQGDEVSPTGSGREAVGVLEDDELVLAELAAAKDWIALPPERVAPFESRKRLVESRGRARRIAGATDLARRTPIVPVRTVTALTPEMLLDGSWRQVELTRYDVTLEAERLSPGKEHPLRRTFDRVRRVFLEMGFAEISSPLCESAFWDFDALFQPQDHPAREMQDTFYVSRPSTCRLPAPDVVDEVKATHETGGRTGSVGWRYEWKLERARQPVLRTHCTAATIRALAQDPRPPRKVFCIGPVFRRETVTYKHLPVFHQVDGIVVDEGASLATLLGTLSAFYTKMGFERFEFRPSFFPYTEPSLEVFVWHAGKGDWVEMGGSGIFRPEVTRPFGCEVPVLAWGLGIERLAMFLYGVERIGDLYANDLAWLKEAPLCR